MIVAAVEWQEGGKKERVTCSKGRWVRIKSQVNVIRALCTRAPRLCSFQWFEVGWAPLEKLQGIAINPNQI